MIKTTKRYQSLAKRKKLLEPYQHDPAVGHIIYLIDSALQKLEEAEELQDRIAILDDKIYCGKAFISLVGN